jgi:hypothetical protein
MAGEKKHLHIVTIEYEVLVMATDEGDAQEVALSEAVGNDEPAYAAAARFTSKHLPSNWSPKSIPWGSDNDEKVGDIMQREREEAAAAAREADFVRRQTTMFDDGAV